MLLFQQNVAYSNLSPCLQVVLHFYHFVLFAEKRKLILNTLMQHNLHCKHLPIWNTNLDIDTWYEDQSWNCWKQASYWRHFSYMVWLLGSGCMCSEGTVQQSMVHLSPKFTAYFTNYGCLYQVTVCSCWFLSLITVCSCRILALCHVMWLLPSLVALANMLTSLSLDAFQCVTYMQV